MKALVVYYSLEGNTKDTAEKVAAELQADLLEIRPKKAYPSQGAKKFIVGGKAAAIGGVRPLTSLFWAMNNPIGVGSPLKRWNNSLVRLYPAHEEQPKRGRNV